MALQDCLEIYDQAISDMVGGYSVESRPTITIFATPDRPFAEVVQELVNADEEFRSQMHESNLIASVSRLDPMYNPKLRVDVPFGRLLKTPLTPGGDIVTSQYPRPYIIPYQLDLRARTRKDANLWIQWVQFKFNPYVCLYPDFGVLWGGQKQIQLLLTSIRDNSNLETDEEERWIRWTVQIQILNAWIFPIAIDTSDIPDPFGMLRVLRVVRDVKIGIYLSPNNPPIPDPALGALLVDTVQRAELDASANLPVESN
jgi:hypothetical protein